MAQADAPDWRSLAPVPDASLPARQPGRSKLAAGTVTVEPDGRIWIVEPTNHFAGYHWTFPKGSRAGDEPLPELAARETWEEAGLLVRIGDRLIDSPRPTSIARMYLARRVGGSPAAMGWESQAVALVPPRNLLTMLNRSIDREIAEAALATRL